MEVLRRSWDALCARANLSDSARLWQQMARRYAEPHRVYHDLRHVAQVVQLLQSMQARDELLLAAWFHDAVYRTDRHDNEAASAAVATELLGAAGLDHAAIGRVHGAILATAAHAAEPCFAALLDADLAILGAAPAVYGAYRAAIRHEYAAVAKAAFRDGRRAFVRGMLARVAIYQTPYCRVRFEARARANLARELEELETPAMCAASCA